MHRMDPKKYALEDMLKWLIKHFTNQGYKEKKYWEGFKPARVPLYFEKEHESKPDEIVIDLTTDRIITKDLFLPTKEFSGVRIEEAAPISFYQYYFIQAKVYFAFPDYVENNDDEFDRFCDSCEEQGIGLLRTSENKIEEVIKPRPLFEIICKEMGIKQDTEQMYLMEFYLRNFLHYLVYYPGSDFTTRGIRYIYPKKLGKKKGEKRNYIGYQITDPLSKLENLVYKEDLKELSEIYRITSNRPAGGKVLFGKKLGKDDFLLANNYVAKLWEDYLGLKLPDIQQKVENILQRDEKYREHFVHQFKVFLIGSYILDSFYPKIASDFYEKYKCKIEKVWLIASTFHDFSYGLQNFDTWLMYFFEDILKIKDYKTKENLNLLNLDAAMIRDALYNNILKIVDNLPFDLKEGTKKKLNRFFYEKAVSDRNHGVLSAISLLQLYYDDHENATINEKEIFHAAATITLHEEDVWEALCGCQGYRTSSKAIPDDEKECKILCNRNLWSRKQRQIVDEKLSYLKDNTEITKYRCERWEKSIMDQRLLDKITFEKNPLVFLLIFCDSVQDEGRVASSDNSDSRDRSSLKGLYFDRTNDQFIVSLISHKKREKEHEIERVAWCLQDERFRVELNGKTKKMNGSGG